MMRSIFNKRLAFFIGEIDARKYISTFQKNMVSLRKLGYNSPYDVKFPYQSNENLKYLAWIVNKDDHIIDLFRAYQYLNREKRFDKYLRISIKEYQIHSFNQGYTD